MAGPTRQPALRTARTPAASSASSARQSSMRPPSRAGFPTGRGTVPPSPAMSVHSMRGASPSSSKRKQESDDEHGSAETNIQVVVRCRGRSEREIRENSTVVVSTPGGPKGKEVALSLGPLGLSNKTYSFDRAFGPEADQAAIYDDVAAPILAEMLSGYNCTIFAYGQTGTGKTYTMSGDMSDSFGTYSDNAGIIPRALYNLFQKLDAESPDYTVKCSFIELYNEELRDLLQADESAKVKIFEDSTKKGIVIQGMEESFIKSAEEGVKLLQDGSLKRQVAATKCNDLSSRSHTVFTITVHVKEPCEESGEDVLRTGKLNLVDLAGSENIGRSGAENKRAREAGMINQSLLTLGRVINALVDKNSHIPYRESKLTRLLQDSLGGRTKTCIIATVSPAKINLEETMSTLDYAARAKNIRNKPQINQMINKKALLRDYVLEIEKLKGDLMATRQKNGVFLTQESYTEITEENESRRIINEEQQRKIDAMENQLAKSREQFENTMRMFIDTKKDFDKVKTDLDETRTFLDETETKLSATKKCLAEETIVRQAHEYTEGKLYNIGSKMIRTLDNAVSDISTLHEKIDKKALLAKANAVAWESSKDQVSKVTTLVDKEIQNFSTEHEKVRDSLVKKMSAFLDIEIEKLKKAHAMLEERTASFCEDETKLVSDSVQAKEEMNKVLEEIKVLREDVKTQVGEGLKGLNDAAQKIVAEVSKDLEKFQTEVHASYNKLGKDLRTFFDETQKQLVSQKAANELLRTNLLTATAAAASANTAAQKTLDAVLEEERALAQEERKNLISQITLLINQTGEQQDKRMTKRVNLVQTAMQTSREELAEAEERYKSGMEEWDAKEEELKETISQQKIQAKTDLLAHWQNAEAQITTLQGTTSTLHTQTLSLVDAQIQTLADQMSALDTFLTRAKAHNESQNEAQLKLLSSFADTAKGTFNETAMSNKEITQNLQDFSEQTLAKDITAMGDLLPPFEERTLPKLRELKRNIDAVEYEHYHPTGNSPNKRPYEYPSSLPRTLPREKLLGHHDKSKTTHDSPITSPVASPTPKTSSGAPASLLPDLLSTPRIPLGEKQVRAIHSSANVSRGALADSSKGQRNGFTFNAEMLDNTIDLASMKHKVSMRAFDREELEQSAITDMGPPVKKRRGEKSAKNLFAGLQEVTPLQVPPVREGLRTSTRRRKNS